MSNYTDTDANAGPVFEITTPDGAVYQIHGASSQDDALEAFKQQYGRSLSNFTDTQTPPTTEPQSKAGFIAGILRGLRDPIDAGAEMLTHGLASAAGLAANAGVPGAVTARDYMRSEASRVDAMDKAAEADYQKQNPNGLASLGRVGGNIAATLPMFAAELPATLPRAFAIGAKQGAAMGLLTPADSGPDDFWSRKLNQAISGAATGSVTGGAATGVSRVVSPLLSPAVRKLLDAGVTPTMGQLAGPRLARLEEAAATLPGIGDPIRAARMRALQSYNRAAINDALTPIDETLSGDTPAGREAIAEAASKISDAYGRATPQAGFQADKTLVSNLQNLMQNAQGMAPDKARQFASIVNTKLYPKFSATGGLSGEDFKAVDSDLGSLASNYLHSTDADQRQLGGAFLQLQAELRNALARANPQIAGELNKANQAYSRLLRVQSAAASTGADGGVFSPAQLSSAVRSLDPSLRKNAFAKGTAMMQDFADDGRAVLGNKVSDSGSSYRNAGLAELGLAIFRPDIALALGGAALGSAGLYSRPGQAIARALLAQRPAQAVRAAAIIRSLQLPRAAAAAVAEPNE